MKVLIVDDDRGARRVMQKKLRDALDVEVVEAADLEQARTALLADSIEVAFVDLCLDPSDAYNRDGLELVKEMSERTSARAVVFTGSGDMLDVRAAMRAGAYDYILKEGLSQEVLFPLLERVRSRRRLEDEVHELRAKKSRPAPNKLVGSSPMLQRLKELIARVAVSDLPVLVQGPSGSGKELVVREVHQRSRASSKPFVPINCAGLPGSLVESVLFGYAPGAFTGGNPKGSKGLLGAVGRGTLFLDEIGDFPLQLQPKLLRVLQERSYRPIGVQRQLPFEGRVVAATHVDLSARVKEGKFREDLYYRLNVLRLRVPSLAERREDIPELVAHFASKQSRCIRYSEDAMDFFLKYNWPGNIRQLENLVMRAAVMLDAEEASVAEVRQLMDDKDASFSPLQLYARAVLQGQHPGDRLELARRTLIAEALSLSGGVKSAAASMLGVNRKVVERSVSKARGGVDSVPPYSE